MATLQKLTCVPPFARAADGDSMSSEVTTMSLRDFFTTHLPITGS
jgi:hypothetical protein